MSIFSRTLNRHVTLDEIEAIIAERDALRQQLASLRAAVDAQPLSVQDDIADHLAGQATEACSHEWVDPTNEVVEAGEYRLCLKCGRLAIPPKAEAVVEGAD